MVGNIRRRTAEEFGDGVIAQVQFPGAAQVENAGKREDSRRGLLESGKGKSELASSGMACDTNSIDVEARSFAGRFGAKKLIGAADVGEGAGPSATRIAHATVFDVPAGDAAHFQRVAEMAGVSEIVFRAPVSAVNEKNHGMRTVAGGKMNVGELVGISAVGD